MALLEGAGPGRTIGIRADMDALPIHEETGLPFASKIAGKMHACGHDVHTVIALGVAAALSELKDSLQGPHQVHLPAGGGDAERRAAR